MPKIVGYDFKNNTAAPCDELRVNTGAKEWQQAGLTPQEMWDEIQVIRKLTNDDGTTGSPSNLVERMKSELVEYRQALQDIADMTNEFQETGISRICIDQKGEI